VDCLIFSVLDSLVARGYTPHVAWRVSFVVVPFIIVMFMALMILFCAPDTPTGKWEDRHLNDATAIAKTDAIAVVDVEKYGMDDATQSAQQSSQHSAELEKGEHGPHGHKRRDSAVVDNEDVQAAEAQLIKKPSPMDVVRVFLSLPTLTQCACYFVTFGCELSINGILGAFYIQASGKPAWTQSQSGDWAAMYGLLNIVTRPVGGYIADMLYPRVGVEGKKYWMIFCIIPL
jgi:MFS transporter, NNP family, nitrate/nitrite transporter